MDATFVCADVSQGVEYVVIPGYGLCSINQSQLQEPEKKRQKTPAVRCEIGIHPRNLAGLTMLILKTRSLDDFNAAIQPLIRLVGSTLTSLHIGSQHLNDQSVETIMNHCNKLRHLSILSAKLTSMEPFIRGYEREIAISSLCLQGTALLSHGMPEFLELLTHSSPVQASLRHIQFGKYCPPVQSGTLEVLDRVLRANPRLEYLEVLSLTTHDAFDVFNRQHSGGYLARQPPLDARWAFLSVLYRLASVQNHGLRDALLGRDIVTAIFDFAAQAVPRMVKAYCPHFNLYRV